VLKSTMFDGHREKFKTYLNGKEKLGKCLICDDRVRKSDSYVTTSEGYTHKTCLKEWRSR